MLNINVHKRLKNNVLYYIKITKLKIYKIKMLTSIDFNTSTKCFYYV